MGHDQWRDKLRVSRRDPVQLADLLAAELPLDGLQHAGSAIVGLAPDPMLEPAAGSLIAALSVRGWAGDAELIDELRDYVAGSTSELVDVAVDLDELAEALDQVPGSESYLDLERGVVWPAELIELEQGPDDFDPDGDTRWVPVVGAGSRSPYADMARFIATIEDPTLVDRLTSAIDGKGAFRRFLNELEQHAGEFTRWHRFRDDARLGRAREWLVSHGYRATEAARK